MEERAKNMRKNLLLLGTCLTLLLTGCSSPAKDIAETVKNVTDNASPTATPEPTGTPAPKEKKLALGKKGSVGDWDIRVKKAEIKTKIKNGQYRVFEPDKGEKFVSITATVRNKGKEKTSFLPRVGYKDKMLTATLYYKEKYKYQPLELLSYDKDLVGAQVNPLSNKSGIIVFSVPKKVAKAKSKLILKIGTSSENVTYSLK